MSNQRPLLQLHQVLTAWSNVARCRPAHGWSEANSLGAYVTPEFAALTEAWLVEAGELPRSAMLLNDPGTCLACGLWDNCPHCYEQAPEDHLADASNDAYLERRAELERGEL